MSDRFIDLAKVTKDYGTVRVVEDLDLSIARGEFVSLLGPSGSGKTTLLMMLAGFESVTGGTITLDGQRINDLPTYRRDMGVVFQNYALFPHMTVAKNVAFPLEMRGVGRAEVGERVALARALVFEPRVVLMDEPLGALDKQLREQMQLDIRDLHHRLGLTIIFVTHDQGEALTMSDRIAVFNRGKIQQCASPREVYDRPANRFVAEFIGETNLLPGRVEAGPALRLAGGALLKGSAAEGFAPGQEALLSLRPERIAIREAGAQAGDNTLPAEVLDTVYQGDHLRMVLDSPAGRLIARLPRKAAEWPVGARVAAGFDAADGWMIRP